MDCIWVMNHGSWDGTSKTSKGNGSPGQCTMGQGVHQQFLNHQENIPFGVGESIFTLLK